MLTADQLNTLRCDLQALANIEYDEILDELLDHYAALTEQKMVNGLTFEDASRWAWADMGSGEGIQRLQEQFVKSLRQQIAARHKAIVKSYFRWPTLITTLLIAVLAYQAALGIPAKWLITAIFGLGIVSFVTQLFIRNSSKGIHTAQRRIAIEYLNKTGATNLNIFQLLLNLPAFLTDDRTHLVRNFLQSYASAGAALSFIAILYTVSFIQLSYERFTYKVAS